MGRLVFFGEAQLHRAVTRILPTCQHERNRQGRDGQISEMSQEIGLNEGRICRGERLGGMFNYFYRAAAKIYS